MFDELMDAIINGNEEKARVLVLKHLNSGDNPIVILSEGLLAGMEVVGKRFRDYEMFLPEVIMSATAMKASMELLKPHLPKSEELSPGRVVMATIEGDVHDIGKNLVSMMLEGAGFEVFDLGVDVPVERIVEASLREKAQLIGISALLTTTMLRLEDAIRLIREKAEGVKVMVGGAPLTKEFAEKIGADGFAPDALRAVNLAKSLVKK